MKKIIIFPILFLFIICLEKEVKASDDIFIKVFAEPSPAYIHSQVKYKLKLYDRIGIVNSQMLAPSASGIEFLPLGQEKRSVEKYQGQDYLVLEWDYAFFPPLAGEIEITAPVFSGKINGKIKSGEPEFYDKKGRLVSNPFKNMTFEETEQFRLEGEKLRLQVLPLPDKRDLFTANSLSLTENWVPADGKIKVGETLTRTFTLNAVGADPSLVPNLLPPSVAGINSFAGKPLKYINVKNKDITVNILLSIAFMHEKEGVYTLPEFTFFWFNNQKGMVERISFPAQIVTVSGSAPNTFFPAQEYEEKRPFYADYKLYKWFSALDMDSVKESVLLVVFLVLLFELILVRIRKRIRKKDNGGKSKRD